MNDANEIVAFLDAAITAGATRAYLSEEDERMLDGLPGAYSTYSYRRYNTKNPMGKYKRKLVIMKLKEDGK
jgi:hypothetical protein